MRDSFNLEGRVVAVTGAGSGIGRGVALAFAEEGSRVVVIDRNAEGAAETAEQVRKLGAQAIALTCDIANAESVQQAAKDSEAALVPAMCWSITPPSLCRPAWPPSQWRCGIRCLRSI